MVSLFGLPLFFVIAVVAAGIILFFMSGLRKLWKLVAAALIALLLALAVTALYTTRQGDLLRGIARMEVVNRADCPVTELCLHVSDGHTGWTETCRMLPAGRSFRFSARTPDFYLGEVSFMLDNETVVDKRGGIACNGEWLVLSIDENGTVTQSYRR